MIKNVAVIDEQGNRYEATYPKRAKGLVKSGRARFVDENTICLARPPYKSEDKTMTENMGSENFSFENAGPENPAGTKGVQGDLRALEEKLKRQAVDYLDRVSQKTGEGQEKELRDKPLSREVVAEVLKQLSLFQMDDSYIVALAEQQVDGEEMISIINSREGTRQRQLDIYRMVLEKAIASESNAPMNAMKQLEQITDWIAGMDSEDFDDDMWERIKGKAYELMDRVMATI